MDSNTGSSPYPLVPHEVDIFISHVRALHALGIAAIPLCRSTERGYCTAHWHASPCPDMGKRPLVQGYRRFAQQLPDRDYLIGLVRKFFLCNLGIVLPQRLVVVEGDSQKGEDELVALAGGSTDHAPTRERRPGRGRGYLFCAPSPAIPSNVIHAGVSGDVDLLVPGSIFVIPPSVHSTGFRYPWVAGRAPWEIPAPPLSPGLIQLASSSSRTREKPVTTKETNKHFAPGLSPRVSFLLSSRQSLRRLYYGDGKTWGDTSNSGVDFTIAKELLKAKLAPQEVAEALAVRPGVHRTSAEYCRRTVEKAMGTL
jgi:hypothetical protein